MLPRRREGAKPNCSAAADARCVICGLQGLALAVATVVTVGAMTHETGLADTQREAEVVDWEQDNFGSRTSGHHAGDVLDR